MLERLRSNAGQTTAEYLGALLLVASIDRRGRADRHRRADRLRGPVLVCKIAGGDGLRARSRATRRARARRSASSRSSDKSIQAVGQGPRASSSKAASPASTACPPTARPTSRCKANAGAGLEFSTPGVEAGTTRPRPPRPRASSASPAAASSPRTWKFDSADDADEFIDNVGQEGHGRSRTRSRTSSRTTTTTTCPTQDSDTDLRRHHVTGSVSAGGGGAYAAAGGSIEAGVGAQVLRQRRQDLLLQGQGRPQRPAGTASRAASAPAATARSSIGITYDNDGNEKAMTVTGVGTVSARHRPARQHRGPQRHADSSSAARAPARRASASSSSPRSTSRSGEPQRGARLHRRRATR